MKDDQRRARDWRFTHAEKPTADIEPSDGLSSLVGLLPPQTIRAWRTFWLLGMVLAVVAALRETSIVFGLFGGWLLFGEPVGGRRLAAVLAVVIGVIVLRLA